jgi:glycosyltransferase involved in cell wall biosynthesis
MIQRFKPDIVHSNDLPTHQFVSNAALGLGIPRICHHRWIFPGSGINWLNKFGAERHLFVSKGLMDELCGNSAKLAAASCAVLYDGLPMPALPTEHDRLEARVKLGLPKEKSVVLFAGQIIERKGVADLLHAWKRLQPKYGATATLVIVGDDVAGKGAYRIEMEELAGELQVDVAFKGFQTNVADWLIASDVVMVPSHAEPLGNATLEAMAQCRPVIGGNVGGIPEMVVHEETGLLVPPKNPVELAAAIERLLLNRDEAQRFGNAARRRCEELFSLDAHIQNVVAEYRRLLLPSER